MEVTPNGLSLVHVQNHAAVGSVLEQEPVWRHNLVEGALVPAERFTKCGVTHRYGNLNEAKRARHAETTNQVVLQTEF